MTGCKRYKLLIAALFWSAVSFAQYIPEQGESFHFTIGYNLLTNKPEGMESRWNSNSWQFQLMKESHFGRKSHWGIAYGLGLTSSYWHTNLSIESVQGSDNQYSLMPADSGYTRNRFAAQYIDVPVEFRYRSQSNAKGQYFRFYFGALAGIRVNSFSNYQQSGYDVKYYHIDEMSRFQYAAYFRTGWYIYNVYVCYNFNPVFSMQPETGPADLTKMKNIVLGLSISL